MKKLLAPLLLLLASVAIADEKISGMSPASLPLSGLELAPLVQNGVNVYTPLNNINLGALPPGQPYCIYGNATGSFASPVCNTTAIVQTLQVPIGGTFTSLAGFTSSGVQATDGRSNILLNGIAQSSADSTAGQYGIRDLTHYSPNGPQSVMGYQQNFLVGFFNSQTPYSLGNVNGFQTNITLDLSLDTTGGRTPPPVQDFESNAFFDNRPDAMTNPVTAHYNFLADALMNGNGAQAGNIKNYGYNFNNNQAWATNNGSTQKNYAAYFQVPMNAALTGSNTNAAVTIDGNGPSTIATIAIVDIGSVATPNTGGGDGTHFIVNWQSTAAIPRVFPVAVGQQVDLTTVAPSGYNITCTVQASPAPVVVIVATIRTSQFTCNGTQTGEPSVMGLWNIHGGSPVPAPLALDGLSTDPYLFDGIVKAANGLTVFGGAFTHAAGTDTSGFFVQNGTGSSVAQMGNSNASFAFGYGTVTGAGWQNLPAVRSSQYLGGVTTICSVANAAPITNTGNLATETNLATCIIPAGILGTQGTLRVTPLWYRNATTTDSTVFNVRHSATSGAITGTTNSVTNAVSGNVSLQTQHFFRNASATAQVIYNIPGTPFGASAAAPVAGGINTAITSYLNFNCTNNTTAGDQCGIYGYIVEAIVP